MIPKVYLPESRTMITAEVRCREVLPAASTPWVAGGSRLATTLRRHLVNDRGVPQRDISFFGYWRLGRSTPG
ncbi:SIP domain-containing protein [Streptomyces sp. NBC_01476]|uniref:SIP domain-containing protein n=1 Tax=Streptomyces sp. NBC_01476 TaxID=2903881 RepID=UPI002E333555|nr:SIP domain-containing protein [Streptomyces sp. NBC_01476]